MNNKLKCLFGFHEYTIPSKNDSCVLICKHCMRVGHRKDLDEYEEWNDFDEHGNETHWKDSDGYEAWNDFDEKGNVTHWKDSDGDEGWSHKGEWVNEKPKNWEYEKEI